MTISTISNIGLVALSSNFLQSNLVQKTKDLQKEYLEQILPMETPTLLHTPIQNFLIGHFQENIGSKLLKIFKIASPEKKVNQFVEKCATQLSKLSLQESLEIQKLISSDTVKQWTDYLPVLQKIYIKGHIEESKNLFNKIISKHSLSSQLENSCASTDFYQEKNKATTQFENQEKYQYALLIAQIALYSKIKQCFDDAAHYQQKVLENKKFHQQFVEKISTPSTVEQLNAIERAFA